MPDQYNFDHLPHWGEMHHQCIEEGCGWPGFGKTVPEADRKRHHEQHTRARKIELEKARNANLAEGRKLKKMAERENRNAR